MTFECDGLAVGTVRVHDGHFEVLEEVLQSIGPMRNYEDAAVRDKRPVHREASAAEVFVDEGALVMEALLQERTGRGRNGCAEPKQHEQRHEHRGSSSQEPGAVAQGGSQAGTSVVR